VATTYHGTDRSSDCHIGNSSDKNHKSQTKIPKTKQSSGGNNIIYNQLAGNKSSNSNWWQQKLLRQQQEQPQKLADGISNN